jgi:hypothetical protein
MIALHLCLVIGTAELVENFPLSGTGSGRTTSKADRRSVETTSFIFNAVDVPDLSSADKDEWRQVGLFHNNGIHEVLFGLSDLVFG